MHYLLVQERAARGVLEYCKARAGKIWPSRSFKALPREGSCRYLQRIATQVQSGPE